MGYLVDIGDDVDVVLTFRELERMTAEKLLFGKTFSEEESKERVAKVVSETSQEERENIAKLLKEKYDTGSCT